VIALDAILYAVAKDGSLGQVAYAATATSQAALLAIMAMLARWSWETAFPFAALFGLFALGWATLGDEAAKTLLAIAVATALWPLPGRLSGQRLVRLTDRDERVLHRRSYPLFLWFLMMAVIGAWIIVAQRLPAAVTDRPYLVATSLGSFLGIRIVLSHRPQRVWAPLYIGIMFVLGFGAMLVSADARATMNWTAPPVHEPLAPIWSPIDFVSTRLANLRYLDLLNVGLTWLATFFATATVVLLVLRFAGFRVVSLDGHEGFLAGACDDSAAPDAPNIY
jgi:hypothetical protein